MGAEATFWTTAFDPRIKAGVLSCHFLGGLGLSGWNQFYRESGQGLFYHDLLALTAPRAILATRGRQEQPFTQKGDYNSPEEENAVLQWCFEYAQYLCQLYGSSPEAMQLRFFDGEHSFPESEREYAYQWLNQQLK